MKNEFGLSSEAFNVVKFLRTTKEIKLIEAVMADRRVEAFKGFNIKLLIYSGCSSSTLGNQAISALLSSSYQKVKRVPRLTSKEDCGRLLQDLLDSGVFVRARAINSKVMQPDLSRSWSDEAVYVWVYQGSQLWTILSALAFLAVSFFFASYQMWPSSLRRVTWYLMMLGFVFMGLLLVISIVRLIVFIVTYFTHSPGIWIFPNLFEDVSFIDSFIPGWDWHGAPTATAKKSGKIETKNA